MKKLLFMLSMLMSAYAYPQIIINTEVRGFGNKISIEYWKDFTYVSDTLTLNGSKASFKFNSSIPVYFKLKTLAPDTYTPFLIGFPGDTIAIEKNSESTTIKGGADSYNMYLIKTDIEARAAFAGKKLDPNTITEYLLNRLGQFFEAFSHPRKQMIKDTYELSVITNYKLYPLMRYANDTGKINALFRFLKDAGKGAPSENDFFKYLNRINFDNPNIGFANITDVMMMNNFIRILRTQAVEKDSTLSMVDAYLLERNIITSLFNSSRYRERLSAYNLYLRIEEYTKYPAQLADVGDFIMDFTKEFPNDSALPAIKNLYLQQLTNIGSLAKGSVAPAFKLPDVNRKQVSLADFKGKVVYLDLWASWCGPCLKEMPYMEALKQKYKNKAVEMIAISIDTDINKWLAKIASMKLQGVQLIDSKGSENSKIAKDYKIHGVPHYILIDKNGRISSAFAPRPSSGAQIEQEINRLL
jgi:thiol-disulfide isomerase/thioredoxin